MKLQCGFEASYLLNMLEKALTKEKELWSPRKFEAACGETEITPVNRNHLVKWLAHLTKKFKFLPETYELAVNTFDRLLQSVKVRFKHMKVLGVACIYLAAKTLQEDNTIPATLELVRESQCGCSVAEIHRMELVILDKLGWDLRAPSALGFMQLFQAFLLSNSPQILHNFAHMTAARQLTLLTDKLQLCLAYHGFMSFRPSTLALAVLSLELELFSTNWFTYTVCLEKMVKCEDSLMICRERVALYLASVPHVHSVYIQQTPARYSTPVSSMKAAKRKVDEIDDDDDYDDDVDDVYDGIKRLYGDDDMSPAAPRSVASETYASVVKRSLMSSSPPSSSSSASTCASQLQLELRAKSSTAPMAAMSVHQTVAVK